MKFSLITLGQHRLINALGALKTAHQQSPNEIADHPQRPPVRPLHESARGHCGIHALHLSQEYEDVAISEQQHLHNDFGALQTLQCQHGDIEATGAEDGVGGQYNCHRL